MPGAGGGLLLTLGIETSCDETAVAVLRGPREILSNEIASQIADHARFGGIVPEVAGRIHAQVMNHILAAALETAGVSAADIDLIAVTVGPGLMVSLVVGISCARALGSALGKPVVGVSHLEGHLLSNFFVDPEPELPALCLLVSGGHTELVLMRAVGQYQVLGATRDDAAGEAFDKVARLLGLPYPGGPAISQAAEQAAGPGLDLPRPMLHDKSLDFSFSGLKTAVVCLLKNLEAKGETVPVDLVAAGFQEAVVDVLSRKTLRAASEYHVKSVLLCGGVAANQSLRNRLEAMSREAGFAFFCPPLSMCTDNAAMVAKAGFHSFNLNAAKLTLSPQPNIAI